MSEYITIDDKTTDPSTRVCLAVSFALPPLSLPLHSTTSLFVHGCIYAYSVNAVYMFIYAQIYAYTHIYACRYVCIHSPQTRETLRAGKETYTHTLFFAIVTTRAWKHTQTQQHPYVCTSRTHPQYVHAHEVIDLFIFLSHCFYPSVCLPVTLPFSSLPASTT